MKRAALAIILLAVGLFLLLEGSRLSSKSIEFDLAMLVVGIFLTISYLPLIGKYLEKKFNAKPTLTYMPFLAILGVGLIWQAVSRCLALLDEVIFVVAGVALLLGSAFYIYKAARPRRRSMIREAKGT